MNNLTTYKKFADCIPVRGYLRSIIMDLTRQSFKLIPNDLCDTLSSNHLSDVTIGDDYIEFLLENEFVYCCSYQEKELYPEICTIWDYPSLITNVVYEVGAEGVSEEIISQLIDLGCKHFVFVWQENCSIYKLKECSDFFNDTSVMTIDIYLKYKEAIDIGELKSILKNNPRINYILLYEASCQKVISEDGVRGNLVLYNKSISWSRTYINPQDFSVNMPLYTESLHYNTFYNRKVCITVDGDIKNYFTSERSFGNVKKESIRDVISQAEFQKYWKVNKDKIAICRDCEFRYMCVDARIPLRTNSGGYYFDENSKCPYNPYICLWEGQDGYVPVEECGTYSRETGFVPNKKKIAQLNKLIWGEEE